LVAVIAIKTREAEHRDIKGAFAVFNLINHQSLYIPASNDDSNLTKIMMHWQTDTSGLDSDASAKRLG